MTPATIRERFSALCREGKRHRDAAAALGLSEGEAIAAHTGQHTEAIQAKALRAPWIELLQALELCGPVLALTRNESTVHEKTGVYQKLSSNGHVGLALGEDIDLRLFFDKWHAGFAVTEAAANAGNPPSLSLQFFDAHGQAVHKVFARDGSDRDAFISVMEQFSDPTLAYLFRAPEAQPVPKADAALDASGLGEAWSKMKDTHEFFGLLRKFDVERQQSFRLMQGRFATRLESGAVQTLLQEAAVDGTPIMVFVGSPGCIQIHSGPVKRIEPMTTPTTQWINVLDAGFNLHLREDLIANVWAVEKPTDDGVVTSVEAFDREGGLMAMFFGVRKPGQPEREDWRALVRKLNRLETAAA
jgi:putative hemin transport protein